MDAIGDSEDLDLADDEPAGGGAGSGDLFARKSAQFRTILAQSLTADDMHAVAKKMVADARADDDKFRLAARAELLNRFIGKPTNPVEPAVDDQSAVMKLSDTELIELFQKQLEGSKVRSTR